MFEKEAEEYNQKVPFKPLNVEKEICRAFKNGAEFGYNKANEEMQEQGLALQSDMDKTIEQNIALKKELNKANEWHKPSEKLPESVAKVRLANWQKYSKELKEAKELIRQLCSMVRELNKPNVQLTNVDYSLAEAEQFISEVENDI